MTKNIIFDFGDVFINLDKVVVTRELVHITDPDLLVRLKVLNDAFEIGNIDSQTFIEGLGEAFPDRDRDQLITLWNSMLLDFPGHRLHFLEDLARSGAYRLFLLSNTNELHIPHVEQKMGAEKYRRFRNSFEGFYLSHEIRMRKPDPAIFEFVMKRNQLEPSETFFVDDTLDNILTAKALGIKTWHLQVGSEDISALKSKL